MTVHGPVKFALSDGIFYLLDEDGREFKATVLEKDFSEKVTTIDQVRNYAKQKGGSEEQAIREFREYGYLITEPAPVPPVAAPPAK